MELVGDVGHVESCFFPFGDSVSGKWKLVLVLSEIGLILTEDRCMVCVERTIGTQIILDTPDGSPN